MTDDPIKPTSEQMMAGYAVACKFGVLEARAFNLAEQMFHAMFADTADQLRAAILAAKMEERERAALLCDDLANMMENGAGEREPGGRLRQAARNIRDGKTSPLRLDAAST